MDFHGPRYIHIFVPCPLGWGSASRDTVRIARLVKETGLFPVFEAEHGEVVGVSKIRRRVPVEEYLKLQRRYAHLFRPRRRDDVIARLQAIADRNVERFGLLTDPDQAAAMPGEATDLAGLEAGADEPPERAAEETNLMRLLSGDPREPALMEKPFAITLDVGSSRANKTGSWRTERAVYVDRLPPCNRLPGGREHPAVALSRRGGGEGYERLAPDHGGQPVPGDHGQGLYHPTARPPATAASSTRRWGSTRSSASSATRIERGWRVKVEPSSSGKRVLVVGAGPSGLSAAYFLARLGHAVTIRDAGPMAGVMRFEIPKYRLPREVLDAEVGRILDLGVGLELNSEVTNVVEAIADGASTPPSSPSAPRSASAPSPPAAPPRARRGVDAPRHGGRRAASVAGSPSMAVGTRRWTRLAPPSASVRMRP